MKTLDEVLNSKKITELNSRSLTRLLKFIPNNQLYKINASRTNTDTAVIPFTEKNVMKELKSDLKFGWEKADEERSISSFLMADVVCMWDWILEDDPTKLVFLDDEDYARYTFREIAKKYNIPLE